MGCCPFLPTLPLETDNEDFDERDAMDCAKRAVLTELRGALMVLAVW